MKERGSVLYDRHTRDGRLPESHIPHRQKGIAKTNEVFEHSLVLLVEQERLSLSIDVRMHGLGRRERKFNLVPSKHHLRFKFPKNPLRSAMKQIYIRQTSFLSDAKNDDDDLQPAKRIPP